MNRYNLALLMLTLAVLPLFYVSGWLSVLAVIAIYCLLARLASNDLDRRHVRSRKLRTGVLTRRDRDPYKGGAADPALAKVAQLRAFRQ